MTPEGKRNLWSQDLTETLFQELASEAWARSGVAAIKISSGDEEVHKRERERVALTARKAQITAATGQRMITLAEVAPSGNGEKRLQLKAKKNLAGSAEATHPMTIPADRIPWHACRSWSRKQGEVAGSVEGIGHIRPKGGGKGIRGKSISGSNVAMHQQEQRREQRRK